MFLSPSDLWIASMEPNDLLNEIRLGLSYAELVHNFGINGDGNCGYDVTLKSGFGQPYFFNLWMLQSLGYVPVDTANNIFTEGVETTYFGYDSFANDSAPDWATSANRPVYAALNMYRGSGGNPQCGPVSAVYSRRYVSTDAIAAPVDTVITIVTVTFLFIT